MLLIGRIALSTLPPLWYDCTVFLLYGELCKDGVVLTCYLLLQRSWLYGCRILSAIIAAGDACATSRLVLLHDTRRRGLIVTCIMSCGRRRSEGRLFSCQEKTRPLPHPRQWQKHAGTIPVCYSRSQLEHFSLYFACPKPLH